MKQNRILVIIVTYNAMPWVDKCLNSLRLSSVPCDAIIIDNGSIDDTRHYVQENFPEVELVEMSKNIGFGQANNIGLRKVIDNGYDYAYLLNQDAWIFPDTFEQLIKASEAHPEYGILSPMQIKADESHFDDKFATNVIGNHQKNRPLLVEDLYFQKKEGIYDVSFVMAAHWFLTRDCIETVGGFSPTFFVYGEDDNYLNRTFFWGMKVGIVPRAKAVHDRSDAVWSDEKNIFIQHYIMPLAFCSDPRKNANIWRFIRTNIKRYIRTRNKLYLTHAQKLFAERKAVRVNREQSQTKTAFLK